MSLNMMIYIDPYGYSIMNYMIGLLIIMIIISWIKTRNLSHTTCVTIFGIYLLFVIDKTLFPLYITGGFAESMREMSFMAGINLIPFNFSSSAERSSVILELGLNVALLVPFGFGLSFVVPFRAKNVFWLAPAVGVSIEVIQLVISLVIGYPYRAIDINDAIMNTLGFLIGYGIFRIFAWLYMAMTHRFNIEHVGPGKYIYGIANRVTNQESAGYNRLDVGAESTR